MNVYISGASYTKFGELWNVSPRDMVQEAVGKALLQSGITKKDIDAVFVGNMLSGILSGQEHIGAFFAEEIGLTCAASKLEGACASGGLAVHAGVMAILSGMYEHVLVLGVEKMTDYRPEEVARALMGAGSDVERESGSTFPALYALIARSHMEKYGTTEKDLAAVAVKNHFHASLNPSAHFPFPVTVEKVLRSSCIASPLKLLDCSPISDGAAALILSKKTARGNSKSAKVKITASTVATDSLGLAERKDLTVLQASVDASKKAYSMAAISPEQIDVMELHDCFTIAEIVALEDLGFYKKGKAAEAIESGIHTLGGKGPIVNTSGGLKACGHPVGATGVKQVVEIYQQLAGLCEKRQVKNARIGLSHNVGGSGATAVVHILQKEI
jgi:acetyl-CoA C-acetyltransferase